MANIPLVSCLGLNRIKINEKIKERMPLKREGQGIEIRGSCEEEMK